MHSALTEILRSPAMPSLVDELQRHRAEEQARRERFYEEITPEDKAEFINGEVIMHSPALVRHLLVSARLNNLLGSFARRHQLGQVFIEKALVVTERNDFEPDIVFYGSEKARALKPDQLKLPPPDFVAEILSPSTEHLDRGVKFQSYALSGIKEYWVVDPVKETVEVNLLDDGNYHTAGIYGGGMVSSEAVTGFQIPVRALFDEAECDATLGRIFSPRVP